MELGRRVDLSDSSTVRKESGGLFYGWIILAAGFLIATITYGAAFSFGVFLTPLREAFGWTTTAVSGVYSLSMFVYGGCGIFAGWAVDKYGPKIVLMLAGFFLGAGLILTSRIDALWQLYATYAVIGVGVGCTYVPLMTTVSRWFVKRRGFVLGISSVGLGSGPLIMAPVASYLTSSFNWRTSYLVIGLTTGLMIVAALLMKKNPEEIGKLPDGGVYNQSVSQEGTKEASGVPASSGFTLREAIRTRSFWLLASMFALVGVGVQMVMAHIVAYSEGNGMAPITAAAVLSTISGASIAGRLVMGTASDWIGSKRAVAICLFIEGVMMLYLIGAADVRELFLFGAIWGFFYGGHGPQFPALAADTLGVGHMGAIMGVTAFCWGIGSAIGPVLAGYVVDVTGRYDAAFIVGAITMFLTMTVSFIIRRPDRGRA